MCGSMTDIQSVTAKARKKDRKKIEEKETMAKI